LVGDLGPGPGQGREQRRLARVGVAHQRHHRGLRALPGLAAGVAVAPDLLDLPLDGLDPVADAAAVRLWLRLPPSARADGAPRAPSSSTEVSVSSRARGPLATPTRSAFSAGLLPGVRSVRSVMVALAFSLPSRF